MKRITTTLSYLALVLLLTPTMAQDNSSHRAYRSQGSVALTASSNASHREIIKDFLSTKGRSQAALNSLKMNQGNNNKRQTLTHYKATQAVNGLQIFGAYLKVSVATDGRLISVIDNLVNHHGKMQQASITNTRARDIAINNLYQNNAPKFYKEPTIQKVAYADNTGALSVAYLVETWTDSEI